MTLGINSHSKDFVCSKCQRGPPRAGAGRSHRYQESKMEQRKGILGAID